ncbi:MAG: hypothetical protein V9G19_14585 [Tetrasphaera sp.]
MSLRVLTALDHRVEDGIAALLADERGVQLVRRCPDLADLLAAAAAGLGDLAIVSTVRGLDRDALAQLVEAGLQVVGITATEDDDVRLRQLGVVDVVVAERAPGELPALLQRLADPRVRGALGGEPVPEPGGRPVAALCPTAPDEYLDQDDSAASRIVAVWGPAGAPGRTTVAVNLAAELAAGGASVLLIDADTYASCVAQVLGLLDESPGVAAAARAAELGTLDVPTLARLTPSVATGFRVLTGLPTSARWSELRAESMRNILEVARRLVQVVVVDCAFCLDDDEELSYDTRAPRRNGATLVTVEAADELVVVGSADPVGLHRLVRGLQDLSAVAGSDPVVVVNRLRSGAVGSAPERRVAEALDRFAGVEVRAFLPDDRASADRCLLAGRVLAEEAPGSVLRERVRQLARSLDATDQGPKSTRIRRWWPRSVTMGRWSTA